MYLQNISVYNSVPRILTVTASCLIKLNPYNESQNKDHKKYTIIIKVLNCNLMSKTKLKLMSCKIEINTDN